MSSKSIFSTPNFAKNYRSIFNMLVAQIIELDSSRAISYAGEFNAAFRHNLIFFEKGVARKSPPNSASTVPSP